MEKIETRIKSIEKSKDVEFANARTIRNFFEQIITRQARRVS